MKLVPLMKLLGRVAAATVIGKIPTGNRSIFRTQARFESGDPRYAWLNRTIAVGEGRVHPDCVEYTLYEISHG